MKITKSIQTYWTGKIYMPVLFPFGEYEWNGVYGIQIGKVFIGIVTGNKNEKPTR